MEERDKGKTIICEMAIGVCQRMKKRDRKVGEA